MNLATVLKCMVQRNPGTSILSIPERFRPAWKFWSKDDTTEYFSHRTDPKPRPEGYRNPKLSAVEALEPSQTGKVPPEPSNGLETAMEAQETAFLKQP